MYEKAIAVFRKSSRCGCQSRIADNCESVKDMAIALDNGRKRSWLSPPCRYSLKRTVFDEYTGAGTNPAVCHPDCLHVIVVTKEVLFLRVFGISLD